MTLWAENTRCEGSQLPRSCQSQGCKRAELQALQPSGRKETQSRGRHSLCTGWFLDLFHTAWRNQEDYCALLSAGQTWRECGGWRSSSGISGFSSCKDENHATISDIIPSVASRLAPNKVHPWLPVRPDHSQRASSNQEAPLLRCDNRCELQCKLQQRSSSSSNKGFSVH